MASQGLNTADTAPPHLHDNASQSYRISAQPAPTELNVSGIAPVQASQQFLSSAHAAPHLSARASSKHSRARCFPCGGVSCGLLSLLALLTAGAWTFAGLCIHRIDSTATVDVAWEPRQCTVRFRKRPPLVCRHFCTDRVAYLRSEASTFTHTGPSAGIGPDR